MRRAPAGSPGASEAVDREAAPAVSRSTPLGLVAAAVGGDGLNELAARAAKALGRPVAILIPTLGPPVIAPVGAGRLSAPTSFDVRIGSRAIGTVEVQGPLSAHEQGWVQATATAAAVAALMREADESGGGASRRALLQALRAGPPADVGAFISAAQRLGFDLGGGAAAICARTSNGIPDLASEPQTLIAELGDGRVYGLVPAGEAQSIASELTEVGLSDVAVSAPRRDPSALHDALREAELLTELGPAGDGQDQTYRLLVGVLIRDSTELEQLRAQTIFPLQAYDREHDTELVGTLREFLAHHGSTTDTAERMQLHRHTVGYRLARVHEVSGLSPYESEGRERLSLGLKADQILLANEHLSKSKHG
jgi:PucR C-terminal helix-turn-helix domain